MGEVLLSQTVYDWLLDSLMSSRLKPGDRLNRRQVARDVGVSVAPVLEAMTQLEWEGFLESRPRLGTRVRQVGLPEVRGRFLLREAIETQAARAYCGLPIQEHESSLMELAREVDQADAHKATSWRAEIAFHRGLIELADCAVLLEAFDDVMRHSLFYAVNRLLPPPEKKLDPLAHQQLVRLLQTTDPEEADRHVRRHLQARLAAIKAEA